MGSFATTAEKFASAAPRRGVRHSASGYQWRAKDMAAAKTVAVEAARVLVVDDEPEMRETCRKILARHGYELSLAECGEAALQKLRDLPLDLAIIDLRLPDMDGLEVLR